MGTRMLGRLPRLSTAAIGASLAAVVLASPSLAADPSASGKVRQLDGAGLQSVLLAPAESPGWFGPLTSTEQKTYAPEGPMAICYVGQDSIDGAKAPAAAYSFFDYVPFKAGGWMNMIEKIYQFPDQASAQQAFALIEQKSAQCAGRIVNPWMETQASRVGDIVATTKVSRGQVQNGVPSVVIDSRSHWTRTGARAPERAGGATKIWRMVGNTVFTVELNKVVVPDARSAISASDAATMKALSLLIGERYLAAIYVPADDPTAGS